MAADIATTLNAWSSTSSSNQPDTSDPVGPNTLAQNLQVIQSVMRAASAGDGTIASATTTDLSTVNDGDITVSGTTTITGFGTLTAGIKKILTFSGALTLTHNATSLILPGAANITTAAGDVAIMRSLGAGNWKCIAFTRSASLPATAGANTDITSMTALTAPTAAANPMRATDLQVQLATRFTAGGTADAMTGTLSPAPAALVTGLKISAVPVGANTVTTSTININSLGAKKEFRRDSSGTAVPITVGDRNASGEFTWVYDSTLDSAAGGWVLLNPLKLKGTNTNDAAAAGYVGEVITSTIAVGSAVSLTTGVQANVTSISLTAGDWDVSGVVLMDSGATTNITRVTAGTSSTSATADVTKGYYSHIHSGYVPGGGQFRAMPLNTSRFSLSGTTTIYLVALANFTVSTCTAYGTISARRVR